jgi:hypothetical protein
MLVDKLSNLQQIHAWPGTLATGWPSDDTVYRPRAPANRAKRWRRISGLTAGGHVLKPELWPYA